MPFAVEGATTTSFFSLFALFETDGEIEMALVDSMHRSMAERSGLYNFQTGFKAFHQGCLREAKD